MTNFSTIFLKRAIILIPIVCAVSSCAGSGAGAPAARVPDTAFTAVGEIRYEGLDCTAEITRTESGEWKFALTAPYAVEGLTVTVSDGETTLEMFGEPGFSDKTDNTVSMARAAALAYDAAAISTSELTASDSGYTLTGTSELGAFRVELDKTGIPMLVSSESGELSIKLSDFVSLKA